MSTDGLAALNAQQEKARTSARRIPAPRHSPKPATDAAPEEQKAATPQAAQEMRTRTATVEKPPEQPASAPVLAGPAAAVSEREGLKRATIYFDQAADDWLEEVLISGRRSKPRADASRSAVVRLALERLRAEMNVDEVVAELRRRAEAAPATPGRKRL